MSVDWQTVVSLPNVASRENTIKIERTRLRTKTGCFLKSTPRSKWPNRSCLLAAQKHQHHWPIIYLSYICSCVFHTNNSLPTIKLIYLTKLLSHTFQWLTSKARYSRSRKPRSILNCFSEQGLVNTGISSALDLWVQSDAWDLWIGDIELDGHS